MTGLLALWLPILLSSVIVFIVSSIIHTVLPWHKNDFRKVPNEDKVMDAVRPFAIPPGEYVVPRPASSQEMRTPEFLEKMNKGPVMMLRVLPNGPTPMGTNLLLWFIYSVVVGSFAACVAWIALKPGADSHDVIHITLLTAFLGYSLALWQMSIWYRRPWAITIKANVDGLIYALLTAATFAWLWPQA